MDSPRQVIRSRRIVTPTGIVDGSVVIEDGVITAVLDLRQGVPLTMPVLDLGDLALLPGLVDSHVHVNEPGRTEWEGWATASRAAAQGGITTIVDMPLNSMPVTTTPQRVADKHAAASASSLVDFQTWGGLVGGMTEPEIEALLDSGVPGLKCFLCDSGIDEFPAVTRADLELAMACIGRRGGLLLAHAELVPHGAPPLPTPTRRHADWAASRPEALEHEAVALLAELSVQYGCRVHVVHCSSPRSIDLAAAAPLVSFETCLHYLLLDADEVADGDVASKCAPPLRPAATREGLWRWVRGTGPVVVSDHSPAPPDVKRLDDGDFATAWGGISSLGLQLPLLHDALVDGEAPTSTDLRLLAHVLAEQPADLAGLARKGRIEAGGDADLVAFDTNSEWTIRGAECGWRWPTTPYEGRTVCGAVMRTWRRGETVFTGVRAQSGAGGQLVDLH